MFRLPFKDRAEAGRLLGAELAAREDLAGEGNITVVALPRGGLPVGSEVAQALKAPLDLIVVRKIGVPWQPELAMGAIAGRTPLLDYRLIGRLGISEEEVAAVVAKETREMERREKLYREGFPAADLHGRTVVLVDDGLATGSTMTAAVRHVRTLGGKRLIVAVPVGSSEACSRVQKEADDCVCLATPEPFSAVGEWYDDFRQVSDNEVRDILKRYRGAARTSE
jgi:putative phosphoribosyl transferase